MLSLFSVASLFLGFNLSILFLEEELVSSRKESVFIFMSQSFLSTVKADGRKGSRKLG